MAAALLHFDAKFQSTANVYYVVAEPIRHSLQDFLPAAEKRKLRSSTEEPTTGRFNDRAIIGVGIGQSSIEEKHAKVLIFFDPGAASGSVLSVKFVRKDGAWSVLSIDDYASI